MLEALGQFISLLGAIALLFVMFLLMASIVILPIAFAYRLIFGF